MWFAPVGAALGLVVAVVDTALSLALPAAVVAVIDLMVVAVMTGGLHLDGLADSADGLFGGGDAARRLRVMHEPGVGAFAVGAVALVLLVDSAALGSLTTRAAALWLALVGSRCAMALAVAVFPCARPEGLGASYRSGLRPWHAVAAAVVAVALVLPFGVRGAVALLAALAFGALVAARALAAIGGLSGDVYGAVCEIAFAGVLVVDAALA